MKKHIPNLITSLNLICGSVSIATAFYDTGLAAWLILLALGFDFLDGFAARLLKAESAIGKQLDSLADVISFGMAPAVIIYILFLKSWNLPGMMIGNLYLFPFVSFMTPLFSAWRLARFNLQSQPSEVFFGLPTPANALLLISIPLIIQHQGESSAAGQFLLNTYTLTGVVIVPAFLMVSRIKLFSLKFRGISWKGNGLRYVFLALSLVLVIVFKFLAIPVILVIYILLSLFFIR